jgi:enoyl-CoA hydratase/carnithine racemase
VVLAEGPESGGAGPAGADAVVASTDLAEIVERIGRVPLAATALAVLLRGQESRSVEAGLAAESAVYSVLQAGPEFAAWRASTEPRPVADDAPTVAVGRSDGTMTVTLDRPDRHNAISARLRDELVAALYLAVADPSIERVSLVGNGPSFCSGGDLDEFGSRPDPASAHRTRLACSPGRLLHRLADRVTVTVHGSTCGGGIELAAFAGRVVARPGVAIALPELHLGLIPGAGGTVSVTRRIGRQRTAYLALSTRPIDAATAIAWGLVDDVAEPG